MRQSAAALKNGCIAEEWTPKPEKIFHFVKIDDVEAFEQCGWVNTGSSLGGYHDQFGVLMEWLHGEPLRKPQR